ncbi:MAG: glycosyltransferase family 4 protein [Ardenticatenaceae bacterium]|nr:glycosyltransferase family 4 protein [Ardenticatenaceae bacterium]
MKLCLVNLDYPPFRTAGLGVVGEQLAAGMVARGHQVTVVTARREARAALCETVDEVAIVRLPYGRTDWIGFGWQAGRWLVGGDASRRGNALPGRLYDVVHFLEARFAWAAPRPYVTSLFQSFRQSAAADGCWPYHSTWRNLLFRTAYYRTAQWTLERRGARRARGWLPASEAAAEEFAQAYGLPRAAMEVIPLGLDLARFQPRPAEAARLRARLGLTERRVLFGVGFATPRKGLEYLAAALPSLPDDLCLLLAGRWEHGYRAKVLAAAGAAASRIIEAGYVPDGDLPAYYTLADLYVTPSLLEGFAYTPAEALACGTPVVATTAGSLPETVGPGGLLVPPRDSGALAEAINDLLADPARRQALGAAGRAHVQARFSLDRMLDGYEGAYCRFATHGRILNHKDRTQR